MTTFGNSAASVNMGEAAASVKAADPMRYVRPGALQVRAS